MARQLLILLFLIVASVMISTTKESAVMGLHASTAICVHSARVVIQLVTVKRVGGLQGTSRLRLPRLEGR